MVMGPLEELIAAARGEIEVDLLLAGASVANLLSGEVHRADVAIHKGRIAGFDCSSARRTMELDGKILAPGFIDGHVHIESSMVTVPEYARAVVPRGTTTVVADPHEIANVWGEAGIRYMLESSRDVPLNVFVMLPSCVPATNLETSGAAMDADALAGLMQEERVLGLAEVMNYPGVIFRDPEVMKKLALAGGRPRRRARSGPARAATSPPTSLQASTPITSAPRLMKPERNCAPACTSCCGRAALRKICSICCRWSQPKTPANSSSSRTTGILPISSGKGISTSW